MASAGGKRGIIAEINVTPLVDIMLVLLIIFMLTANLIAKQAIEVELPRASQSTAAQPDDAGDHLDPRRKPLPQRKADDRARAARGRPGLRGQGPQDPGHHLGGQVGLARSSRLGARRGEIAWRGLVRDPDRSHGDDGTRQPMIRDSRMLVCAGLSIVGHLALANGLGHLPRAGGHGEADHLAARGFAAADARPAAGAGRGAPGSRAPAGDPPARARADGAARRRPTLPRQEAPPPERPALTNTGPAGPVFGVTMESTSQAGSGPAVHGRPHRRRGGCGR